MSNSTTMQGCPMLSFVIPCYKSEKTIEGVVAEIKMAVYGKYTYEIILINDCSQDRTINVIRKLCSMDMNIRGISFARNFGQHNALMAGFRYVKGDIIIVLDDDGQTPANECLKLIEPLINMQYDVAIARYIHKRHNWFKNLGSRLNDIMACYLLEKPRDLYYSSYFAARRFVIDEVIKYENPYPYLEGLVLRITKNIINVEVCHRKREYGKSNYSFKKLFSLWLNGFTAFSVKPLRMASILGIVLAFIGFLYLIYVVLHRFIYVGVVAGWSSVMATQLIIGGATLCVLGLIGEYIGRIYICLNNSPQYVIKELINIEGAQKDEWRQKKA